MRPLVVSCIAILLQATSGFTVPPVNSRLSTLMPLKLPSNPKFSSCNTCRQQISLNIAQGASLLENVAESVSKKVVSDDSVSSLQTDRDKFKVQFITLLRVGVPSIVAGIAACFAFPGLALFLASIMNDAGVFAVLSQDSSQFVQNFLTVSGLL
jgi:hypothetical protein